MPVGEAPLVEREREIEALDELLGAARDAAGGALLVEGPPGIGKSSLLAAARATGGDFRAIGARGSELEREFPFGIARQLLEPVLAGAGEPERNTLLGGAAALAEPVVVAPDPGAPSEPPYAVLRALYWCAVNLASVQPVLAVVDDLQWADVASLRWLLFVARRIEGVPLALVLATRPVEAGPAADLVDELVAIPEVGLLRPGDLSESAVAELTARALPGEPDPSFVAACHGATGGNPFLLRELLEDLARAAVAPTAENSALPSRLSSQGVSRAVRARLRGLGDESVAVARSLAVLGDDTELGLVARLAGLDDDAASRAVDRLVDASILEPERPLSFVHPLVRSSIEGELSAGARAGEHRRAARLLAEAGTHADRIPLHLLATDPIGDAETVETLRRAALDAGARGAPDVAATYLRRALEESQAPEPRAAITHELGEAALRAGDLDTAIETLRDAVGSLASDERRALAANSLGTALALAHRQEDALAVLSEVIDALPDSAREEALRLEATRWAVARTSLGGWTRLRESERHFALAPGAARTTGERLLLCVTAFEASRKGTAQEARERAATALAGAGLMDDPGPEAAGFWFAPLALVWAGALEDATRVCGEVIEWANRHGSLPAFAMGAQLRALAWWRRGALDEAEADATLALEHAALPGFPPYGRTALVNVHLARGRTADAAEILRQAELEPRASTAVHYMEAIARLKAVTGRPEEALEDLRTCGRLEDELGIETPAVSTWRCGAASLLASFGRTEEARVLAVEELARCRAFGAAAPLGVALRTLGTIEPTAAGIALLEEAVGVLEASAARLEQAVALLELGAALRRQGKRADAREPLRRAMELSASCGAETVAARAHDELVASGARPRRDPVESRSKLTAGELRVARMAADGLTNRQIAQDLFLTENTIRTHLKSAFRKLEIESRSQLARAL